MQVLGPDGVEAVGEHHGRGCRGSDGELGGHGELVAAEATDGAEAAGRRRGRVEVGRHGGRGPELDECRDVVGGLGGR